MQWLRSLLGRIPRPVYFVAVGVVLGFPLFVFFNWTMIVTSTPEFCGSCHEIQPAVAEWKSSTHYHNKSGVVAECMDCHLPKPYALVSFYYEKSLHGLKDITSHYFGGKYDREAQRLHSWTSFKNSRCLKCHKNLLAMQHRGARLAHMATLHPKPGSKEKRCVQCHENLVHRKRTTYPTTD